MEEHECPKNFDGRSKIMEASAILKMVEDAFYDRLFFIDVIVSDDDSNDKEAIIECILYHIQNCKSLHTFRAPLKDLWALMFFCFLSSLIRSITLPTGL